MPKLVRSILLIACIFLLCTHSLFSQTMINVSARNQGGWNRKGLLSDKEYKKKAWHIMFYQKVSRP